MGRLGRDPDIKNLQSGSKFASFSIATSEKWKNKQGEWQEKTQWHNIVVWNEHTVGVVAKYVIKGTRVYVEGALETRKWQGSDGNDRYSTEVVLKGYSGKLEVLSGGRSKEDRDDPDDNRERDPPRGRRQESRDIDDEIPF